MERAHEAWAFTRPSPIGVEVDSNNRENQAPNFGMPS